MPLGGLRVAARQGFALPGGIFLGMYVLYLDESGTVKTANEDYIVLGGVAIFERQIYWVEKALADIARKADPAHPSEVELHASTQHHGREMPWLRMRRRERQALIKEALRVLSNVARGENCAFACAVHKKSFPGDDPMEIAYEQICTLFDAYLQRLRDAGDEQRGMIVVDECSYEEAFQQLTTKYRQMGTRWGRLKFLCQVPVCVDSRACRLVQLADHVSYATYRFYERQDRSYFDVILPQFDQERDKLQGLIHLHKLDRCTCPACRSTTSSSS